MNKRSKKAHEKAQLKNLAEPLPMNKAGSSSVLFQALTASFKPENCPYTTLRDTVNRVLTDTDPAQEMEEEYKVKNDTVFCWKFLR